MRLVLDNFAFKVTHQPDGSCALLLNPVESVDDSGGFAATGIPLVVPFAAEQKEGLIKQLQAGSGLKRANADDLAKATKGLAVPPSARGRSA